MLIEITMIPSLVPCHPDEGWRPASAPPLEMRKVWLGRTLWADFYAPGAYQYVLDRRAKIIDLVPTPDGRRVRYRRTLVHIGDPHGEPLFLVKFLDGLRTVESMNANQLVLEWYRLKWPAGCDFIFWHSEVNVLSEG